MKSNLELMQNVVKPYIDAKNQALTNEVRGNWATGGVNLFNGKFSVGYNISNEGDIVSNSKCAYTTDLIAVTGNKVTVSFNKALYRVYVVEYGTTNNFIRRNTSNTNISTFTATLSDNCKKIRVAFNYDDSATVTNEIANSVNTQVELGDTATPYQPYAKTNVELTDALANAKCVVDANGIVSVNADGTKTYSQLLDSLTTAFLAKLESLPDGHYIVVDTVYLGGLSTYRVQNKAIFTNNTSSFNLYGIFHNVDNSNIITNYLLYSSTSGNSAVRYALTNVSAGTSITNKISDVPTNDKSLIIYYTEYKSV